VVPEEVGALDCGHLDLGDAKVEMAKDVSEDVSQVNESVIVVLGLGLGRGRVRERNVVTTKVITLEGVLLLVLGNLEVRVSVGGLVGGLSSLIGLDLSPTDLRDVSEMLSASARAVGANTEEVLDCLIDDGPGGDRDGLLETTVIVGVEADSLLLLDLLGEDWVDEEDG